MGFWVGGVDIGRENGDVKIRNCRAGWFLHTRANRAYYIGTRFIEQRRCGRRDNRAKFEPVSE